MSAKPNKVDLTDIEWAAIENLLAAAHALPVSLSISINEEVAGDEEEDEEDQDEATLVVWKRTGSGMAIKVAGLCRPSLCI